MIGKNYIFQITFQGTKTITSPINDDFLIEWTKENEQIFFRKVVSTQFLFCKDDFNLLFDIESSCDRCELVQFDIIRKCSTGDFNIFTGFFNMNEGDWDEQNCSVLISPSPYDEYNCLFDSWEEEQNILNATTKQEFGFFIGVVECQQCTGDAFSDTYIISQAPYPVCLPISEGWTLTGANFTNTVVVDPNISLYQTTNGVITATYCREFLSGTVAPNGGGWVAVSGGFARPLNVSTSVADTTITNTATGIIVSYKVSGFDDGSINDNIDNGVLLSDILNKLNDCGHTIKSNFFGINSDNSNPTNQAYTFALANLQNLIWFQKTDIKNASAQNNATIANLDLKTLLETLQNTFNVRWVIQNDVLCIEHVSYFQAVQGQDISNLSSIQGKRKYSYRSEELPQYEVFEWMDSVSTYFEGSRIIYKGFCVTKGAKKEYNIEVVTTDFNYIINNPDSINDEGFFLLAAIEYQGAYYIENDNKALSWTELHENLWRWNRPQLKGNMNGIDTTFETAIRLKQQEELEFRLCCEDLENFNPSELINTNMGWAEISKATFSGKSNCIKIDPLLESNCN